jgi:hypothetical protein
MSRGGMGRSCEFQMAIGVLTATACGIDFMIEGYVSNGCGVFPPVNVAVPIR